MVVVARPTGSLRLPRALPTSSCRSSLLQGGFNPGEAGSVVAWPARRHKRQLDQAPSLHAVPVKLTPYGAGFASNPAGGDRVRHHAERHDHGRIARLRGDAPRRRCREQEGVESIGLERGVDAVAPGERDVLLAIGLVSRAIACSPSRRRCRAAPVRTSSVPAASCARFQARSSSSVFTGAEAPSDASHALKSRFMPYLKTIEQSSSRPSRRSPLQSRPRRRLFFGSDRRDDRDVGRIDDVAPCARQDRDRLLHTAFCAALRPPLGAARAGRVIAS